MPSFMIGDILDQKRSIQSPLEQSDESLDWEIPSLKDINPMDLCTRLPFSITPWLSNQQFASDLRFTEQEKLHPHDSESVCHWALDKCNLIIIGLCLKS